MRVLGLLCLALVLGGCMSPAMPEGTVTEAPAPIVLDLSSCTIIEALGSASEAAVAPHVPEGFEPAGEDGQVMVVFGGATCGGHGARRAFVAIAVRPTDPRLRAEGVDRHYYEPEHLVQPGDLFAEAVAIMRGPTPDAQVATRLGPPVALETRTGAYAHSLTGLGAALAPQDGRAFGGTFREWFAVEGGYGYLQATFGAPATVGAALARLELGEGSVARELLGAQPTLPTVVLEKSAYAEAVVGRVAMDAPEGGAPQNFRST